MNTPATRARERAERRNPTKIHICDCGRVATHFFGGWECQRCFEFRQAWDRDSAKYTRGVGLLTSGRTMVFEKPAD